MAFFVLMAAVRSFNDKPDRYRTPFVSRRECLRYIMCGWGLMLTMPLSLTGAAEVRSVSSILDKYLGEELRYRIGYWLLDHVGDATTGFMQTDISGIYKISLEDVSSGSGEFKGWLSSDATPVKGTIEDVVFFGDLWGDLIEKQHIKPVKQVKVPAELKSLI